ncbi:MAG: hypothetical protein MJZ11_06900 [Lachnospiraceae bacterium]|nr:hypothetical protein [Lachnospiraceae bacterium]
MNTDKRWNNDRILQSIIVSTLVLFLGMLISRVISMGKISDVSLPNIILYGLAVIVSTIVFFAVHYLRERKKSFKPYNKYVLLVFYLISYTFILLSVMMEDKYTQFMQTDQLFRHTLWLPLYILLLATVVNVILYKISKEDLRVNCVRVVAVIICSISVVFLTFSYNPFADVGGKLYHLDAYANSIFFTERLIPYSSEVNSIYGHYGIFYIIPVKIFHLFMTKWHAISLAIALTAGITYVLFAYILNKIIKKDIIFSLALLALGFYLFGFSEGNYYQLFPHRFFFQAITVFFLYELINNPKESWLRRGVIIIASLSVVWNLEIGMVCAIACCVCKFVLRNNEKTYTKFRNVLITLFEMFTTIFVAYVIVAIYNVSVGGEILSIRDFVYPIMSQEYHVVEDLQLPFDIPVSFYFIYLSVFLGAFCFCGKKILSSDYSNKWFFVFLCAIIGLGVFPYYINRVCYSNMQIVLPMLIIILACYIDSCSFDDWCVLNSSVSEFGLKELFGKLLLYILVIISLESIFNFRHVLERKKDSYSVEFYNQFVDRVGDLSDGTAVIGKGSSVLCTCISNDNMIYSLDWEDISRDRENNLYAKIKDRTDIKRLIFPYEMEEEVRMIFPNMKKYDEYVYIDNEYLNKWSAVELNN